MSPRTKKSSQASPSTKTKRKKGDVLPDSLSPEPRPPPAAPCTKSQPWDYEDGALPSKDGEEVVDNSTVSSQVKNASSLHWAAWQDWLLVQQALALQPFLKPSKHIKAAWDPC